MSSICPVQMGVCEFCSTECAEERQFKERSMSHVTVMPRIQRLPCALHEAKVAAICDKCHELAERQRDAQYAKERKEAHQEYLRLRGGK